tara:strand:- start:507 stop:935 length:429 start_codon:yes stop_codon:yes gene_type:complete
MDKKNVTQTPVEKALEVMSEAMKADPGFAWSWHCNVAMAARDAGAPHKEANERAADFMKRAFGVDTSKEPVGNTDSPVEPPPPAPVPADDGLARCRCGGTAYEFVDDNDLHTIQCDGCTGGCYNSLPDTARAMWQKCHGEEE